MLKALRRKSRKRKITRALKDHASEILVGLAVGLLTDIATDVAHRMLTKKTRKNR